MPWCPRCDETFPQGPACPRCNARLVQRERETLDDTLQSVPSLRSFKVSRRYEKAFDRLSGSKRSSSRALALALVLLVFASGYLLGRVGTVGQSTPTVRALPPAEPIPLEEVKGSVSYLIMSRDGVATLVLHDLYLGEVTPRARFSSPVEPGEHVTGQVTALGRSVAIVVQGGGAGTAAFAPSDRTATTGLDGSDAAWVSEEEVLIRHADGSVVSWTSGAAGVKTKNLTQADALFQTSSGPVVRRGNALESLGTSEGRLELPRRAEIVAVSSDVTRALLDGPTPVVWDGRTKRALRMDPDEIFGASFEHDGEHLAAVISNDDELMVAVVDARGNASLKPLGSAAPCRAAPAWDGNGHWIYVATAEGMLHAVEAHGGRISSIRTHGVGCGVAWVDTA